MDRPVISSILFVLVVFGSISPRIVVGSLIDRRIIFDFVVNSNVQHLVVSPSSPPPPPPSPPPPPPSPSPSPPPPSPSPPPPSPPHPSPPPPSPPPQPPPPSPSPPPMSPTPPPSPWAPPPPQHPKKKKNSNITTNSASHAKGANHPFNPHQKMNIGKKIGLLFAGIAGIMQVAVFGFLGFRRWEISKIKDRHDFGDRS